MTRKELIEELLKHGNDDTKIFLELQYEECSNVRFNYDVIELSS